MLRTCDTTNPSLSRLVTPLSCRSCAFRLPMKPPCDREMRCGLGARELYAIQSTEAPALRPLRGPANPSVSALWLRFGPFDMRVRRFAGCFLWLSRAPEAAAEPPLVALC